MKKSLLSTILRNKVILYLITRYIVYALQFVGMLILSVKLGPYNYGRWGFVFLLLSYFSVVNFGIPSSVNVLLVQNKKNPTIERDYVASSFVALSFLMALIVVLSIIYFIKPLSLFEKYHIDSLFYLICIIAAINYINAVFGKIYRLKNRLLELSINQSLFPLLIIVCSCVFSGAVLFHVLLVGYLVVVIFCFIMYIVRGAIPFGGSPQKKFVFHIFKKGFFLFLYNSCFYLILTTTATIISYYYSVEEYGLYSFSYSLGHSVLLILEAFTFIAFPKLLDKYYTGTKREVVDVISKIRVNYVALSHGLMYIFFATFPLFIKFFPAYEQALPSLCLTALAVLLNTNSFAFNSYLIAKNDEKHIAKVSFSSLVVNILFGIMIVYCDAPYYYVVICMMISYLMFAFLCSRRALYIINGLNSSLIDICISIFPLSLLIPFICGVTITILHIYYLSYIPFVLYVIFNYKIIKDIISTVKNVAVNPAFLDIRK